MKRQSSNGTEKSHAEYEELLKSAQDYTDTYLDCKNAYAVSWVHEKVAEQVLTICPVCRFVHISTQECDICAGLPDKARTALEKHNLQDIFGDYLSGHRDIGKELSGLRSERAEALYNLYEGAYEAIVYLSVEAALNGLQSFWKEASERRAMLSSGGTKSGSTESISSIERLFNSNGVGSELDDSLQTGSHENEYGYRPALESMPELGHDDLESLTKGVSGEDKAYSPIDDTFKNGLSDVFTLKGLIGKHDDSSSDGTPTSPPAF